MRYIRYSISAFLVLTLLGCNEEASVEQLRGVEQAPISRRLPTADREYLLQPLESALDDLREVREIDPSLTTHSVTTERDGRTFTEEVRLDGDDTAAVRIEVKSQSFTERHERFWDEKGTLFLVESHTVRRHPDGEVAERRSVRMYFEEGFALLSAYGKTAYGDARLPSQWVTICPTAEEVDHALGR